jgi:hypothetical protein
MSQQQGGMPLPSEYADATPEPIDITPEPAVAGEETAADRPRPTITRRRVMLGSLLVVGLAGAAVFGVTGVQILREKDAVLTAPDRAAGLTRDDSQQATEAADYLRTALAAGVDLDTTVGAVYNDPGDADRSVLIFGGTALLFSPGKKLDGAFTMLGDKTGDVAGLRKVPAGDLGGVMKCGTVSMPEGNMAVCGWADHGSIALAMFPGRAVDASAPLMRELRKQIQTRS